MAAVVCQSCRTAGEKMPAFQMLIYPATAPSRESASRHDIADVYFPSHELIDCFWNA